MAESLQHVWYYQRTSLLTVVDEGPFSDQQMMVLAKEGKLKLDTPVRSPTRTKNNWIAAESVPAIAIAINQRELDLIDKRRKTEEEKRASKQKAAEAKVQFIAEKKSARRAKLAKWNSVLGKAILTRVAIAIGAIAFVIMGLIAILASQSSRSLSSEAIVSRTEDSVAKVRGPWSQGTGFMVSPRLLVTNRHVTQLSFDSTLAITFPSVDKDKSYSGRIIYDDPELDISIVELESDHPTLPLAPSFAFKRGAEVTVIGNPSVGEQTPLDNAVSRGLISTQTKIDGQDFYQLSISINPGNSGGPALDTHGRVIGIVTLKAAEEEGIAFCIPSDRVEKIRTIATSLTDSQKAKSSFQHNSRALVELIAVVSVIHLEAMAKRADTINAAIDLGFSGEHGVRQSQAEADAVDALVTQDTFDNIGENVKAMCASEYITADIRARLVDAWTTLGSIRDCVQSPAGYSANTYDAKFTELMEDQKRTMIALRLLMNME